MHHKKNLLAQCNHPFHVSAVWFPPRKHPWLDLLPSCSIICHPLPSPYQNAIYSYTSSSCMSKLQDRFSGTNPVPYFRNWKYQSLWFNIGEHVDMFESSWKLNSATCVSFHNGWNILQIRIYIMSMLFWKKYNLLEKQNNPFWSPRLNSSLCQIKIIALMPLHSVWKKWETHVLLG